MFSTILLSIIMFVTFVPLQMFWPLLWVLLKQVQ